MSFSIDDIEKAVQQPELTMKFDVPGDYIAGDIDDIKLVTFRDGTEKPLSVIAAEAVMTHGIKADAGLWDVWTTAKILRRMIEKRWRKGDRIAIKFVGTKKVGKGTMKDFVFREEYRGIPFEKRKTSDYLARTSDTSQVSDETSQVGSDPSFDDDIPFN